MNNKKAMGINPRLIIILTLIGIIYLGLYYTGSLPIAENEGTFYQYYTFNDDMITYTNVYDNYYESFSKHVYKTQDFNEKYITLTRQFDALNKNDYVCTVSGKITSLCSSTYLKPDRCTAYNRDIKVNGVIEDFFLDDANFKIWGCVIDRKKVFEDLGISTSQGVSFSGQVSFIKKTTSPEDTKTSLLTPDSEPVADNIPVNSATGSELSFIDKINLWIDGIVNKIDSWINNLF